MTREELSDVALSRSAVPESVAAAFADGMDDRWFDSYDDDLLMRHLEGASSLTAERPFALSLEKGAEPMLSVITWDAGGLFSLIAGILAVSGFNILGGDAFTVRPSSDAGGGKGPKGPKGSRHRRPGTGGKKGRKRVVVDVFRGCLERPADADRWFRDVAGMFDEIGRLLGPGDPEGRREARAKVQRWVAEAIARDSSVASGYLQPVELVMGESPADMNRMTVLAEDTPFFLYALGTALALEGISIERVAIRTLEGRIEDTIDFTDEAGARIADAERLDRVKMAVLLTKQFTYFLAESPDPLAALERFEMLVRDVLEQGSASRWLDLLGNPLVMRDLAALLGASDFLWEDFIRRQYETLLPMLKPHIGQRSFSKEGDELEARLQRELEAAEGWDGKKRVLNAFKDKEIFRIDLDHILVDGFDFRRLSRGLSRLADVVVQTAMRISERRQLERYGRPRGAAGIESTWAVFGLGKLGGSALGYASDIELLFVYSDSGSTDGGSPTTNADYFERLLRDGVSLIDAKREGIFQVDLRLRPYGKSGILATSLEAFCSYYARGGEAASLEKLALVRLRRIGGDPELGARVERIRDEIIYAPGSLDRRELTELRRRQLEDKTKPGRINAKFSVGALVDLESTVQILQAEHGETDASLRTPSVHEALSALARSSVLESEEAAQLAEAYDFLRNLINALRMLRGSAKDLDLPEPSSEEYRHLARRMGYRAGGDLTPERKLRLEFETRTAQVRAFVEAALGRDSLPGPTAGNIADLVLSADIPDEKADGILSRSGFKDTLRARRNLAALAGEGSRRRRFARLMVLATDTTYQSADPDMALNNWERLVANLDDPEDHFDELLAQPTRLEILHKLLAGSQFLADSLIRDPALFESATDPQRLSKARSVASHLVSLAELDGRSRSREEWRNALRAYRRQEILRIGTRDFALNAPLAEVAGELANLAEAVIEAALRRILREAGQGPEGYCILAFGKLGGGELNYSSDIDILGLASDPASRRGIQEALRNDLSVSTSEGAGYRVDMRLRPWGRSGDLVQGMDALVRYYADHAAQWEIQALLKLRPVAGDRAFGEEFLRRASEVHSRPADFVVIAEAIEKNRIAAIDRRSSPLRAGERDIKDGHGGIRDIEFLVQGLQLKNLPEHPELKTGNTLEALDRLAAAGLLEDEVRGELVSDYILLRRIEHLLQIFDDRQVHHLPSSTQRLEPIAIRTLGPGAGAGDLLGVVDAANARVYSHYRRLLLEPAGLKREIPE